MKFLVQSFKSLFQYSQFGRFEMCLWNHHFPNSFKHTHIHKYIEYIHILYEHRIYIYIITFYLRWFLHNFHFGWLDLTCLSRPSQRVVPRFYRNSLSSRGNPKDVRHGNTRTAFGCVGKNYGKKIICMICVRYSMFSLFINFCNDFCQQWNRVWWMVHRLRPLASDIESSWSWWSVVYFRYPQSHFIWRHGSFHASMHHYFDTMCIFQKVHAMSCFIR